MAQEYPTFTIRPAVPEDVPSVTEINNHYIRDTVLTFATEERSEADVLKSYTEIHSAGYPYLVAEDKTTKQIVGYTYVAPYHSRVGYRFTVELSLFCHPDHVRRSIGRDMLNLLLQILRHPEDYSSWIHGRCLVDIRPRRLMAVMAVDVDGPGQGLRLKDWYMKQGFDLSGHLKKVGWKKERWIDVMFLQKDVDEE